MDGPPTAADALEPVRRLLDEPVAELGSFVCRPIEYRAFQTGRTVWAVSGEASIRHATRSFDLVAKDSGPNSIEGKLFDSGVVDDLAGPIRGARYLGRTEIQGGLRLWFAREPQHVEARTKTLVALAGDLADLAAELSRKEPPRWLPSARQAYDQEEAAWGVAVDAARPALEQSDDDTFPHLLVRQIAKVLGSRDRLLDLATLPHPVLCHADAGPHNLLRGHDGRIVLIDWEHAVAGDLGLDLAAFVNGALITGTVEGRIALDFHRDSEAAYLDRLARREPSVDIDAVRLAYRAHATLRWGSHIHLLGVAHDPSRRASVEHHWSEPFDELLTRRRWLSELFVVRAESVL